MLGQGVNMAITDVCICATRIAFALKNNKNGKRYDGTGSSCSSSSIPSAIASFDTSYRREQSKMVVKQSRSIQNMFLSSSPLICWFLRLYCRFASMSEFTGQVERVSIKVIGNSFKSLIMNTIERNSYGNFLEYYYYY
ncbi:hypothetical protein FRACYDRAFT_267080 [Fragilariopsis cylindrus CCMP1102]|uniref:Uncharacterized protein n=1 Tax=Fragilariopsis cylindrus CCMP1102 TaxID=635003 RepID=A0A1E7FUP2_9STRA|nr:hypothetical protein FRACYDRAFT_267080 [Fragilariopsis cylindrus CCMP1102]|eukprot:OEU21878.1 hypothetical protein FRACYDRAFT_267080 [Fragilariopsis cylindrus CCMP1102]